VSARKPSVATQLKTLRAEYAAQTQQVEKLTKELASEKSGKDCWYKKHEESKAELEQAHALIDALPGSIPRQSEPGEYGQRTQHALMTRLAAWMAIK
jgi:hypothetical protein